MGLGLSLWFGFVCLVGGCLFIVLLRGFFRSVLFGLFLVFLRQSYLDSSVLLS